MPKAKKFKSFKKQVKPGEHRQKMIVAMMQKDNPDSTKFLDAQIAFMESLKNRDKQEASINKKERKMRLKKKSAKHLNAKVDEETKRSIERGATPDVHQMSVERK